MEPEARHDLEEHFGVEQGKKDDLDAVVPGRKARVFGACGLILGESDGGGF